MLYTTVSGVPGAFLLRISGYRYGTYGRPLSRDLEPHVSQQTNWAGAAVGNVQGPANQGDSFKKKVTASSHRHDSECLSVYLIIMNHPGRQV
jgi:hypothetical protein